MPALKVNRDEFRRLHAEGMNLTAIAAHFGIWRGYASTLRKQLGLPPGKPGRPKND